jgi:aminocarboxymuconate-semialdehyde decarboxylase
MLAGRLRGLEGAGPEAEQVAERLKHQPLDYLKRFYADTANFGNPIALRAALDFFGPDHVLFGTDFGFDSTFAKATIHDIEMVITDEDLKQRVYERNAHRILQLDQPVSHGLPHRE